MKVKKIEGPEGILGEESLDQFDLLIYEHRHNLSFVFVTSNELIDRIKHNLGWDTVHPYGEFTCFTVYDEFNYVCELLDDHCLASDETLEYG